MKTNLPEMFKQTASTILVTVLMLAAPALIYAQDISAAQAKKATTAKTAKSGRIDVDGIQYH